MSIKCYFSGIEGRQHYEACVDAGVRHVLISYLYIEKNGDFDVVKKRKEQHPHLRFMVDSGAHTFQSNKEEYASWSLTTWEEFIQRYTKWLRKNKEFIDCGVELDVDFNVGTNVVESWQQKYFIPLLAEGVSVIFVWHKQRGLQGWEEMCSRFPYVGLPGEFSGEPDFNKYMTTAKRYTAKVHGFAATKQSDFRDWPWWSSDSTTWKSSERYGTLIHWDEHEQKLIFEDDKRKRHLYRKDFERFRLDADGIIKDANYREVTKYALISMRRMEEFYEKKYEDRTFYYEMRLPHPKVVERLHKFALKTWWKRLRPVKLFSSHHLEADVAKLRTYLCALAAIQYKEIAYLQQSSVGCDFLRSYFPKLDDLVQRPELFQVELSTYLAPPNPPALQRIAPEHFVAQNSPPKYREEQDVPLRDLEFDYNSLAKFY